MIGIIDYGAGNLRSVENAIKNLSLPSKLIANLRDVDSITHLVFPGQGHFDNCMKQLENRNLTRFIIDWIKADKPYLGICLGYQVLFEKSEESPQKKGLGIFKGQVIQFDSSLMKVPHMGWNQTTLKQVNSTFWKGFSSHSSYYYFVHSYYPVGIDNELVAMETQYSAVSFVSAIQKGNLLATQFHPEKSQSTGNDLMEHFFTQTDTRKI